MNPVTPQTSGLIENRVIRGIDGVSAMAQWVGNTGVQLQALADAVSQVVLGQQVVMQMKSPPVLMLYGAKDELVQVQPSIARARQLNDRIQTTIYENSGHAPFLEEAARFNQDLAKFADSASTATKKQNCRGTAQARF